MLFGSCDAVCILKSGGGVVVVGDADWSHCLPQASPAGSKVGLAAPASGQQDILMVGILNLM